MILQSNINNNYKTKQISNLSNRYKNLISYLFVRALFALLILANEGIKKWADQRKIIQAEEAQMRPKGRIGYENKCRTPSEFVGQKCDANTFGRSKIKLTRLKSDANLVCWTKS